MLTLEDTCAHFWHVIVDTSLPANTEFWYWSGWWVLLPLRPLLLLLPLLLPLPLPLPLLVRQKHCKTA